MRSSYCNNGSSSDHTCHDLDDPYGGEFKGQFLTAVGVIGLICNIFNVVIFRRIYKRQMVLRLILTAIAVSDFVEIVIYLTQYSFDYFFDHHTHPYQEFLHSNLDWTPSASAMTMTLNRWLVVLMSAERFYVIRRARLGMGLIESKSKVMKVASVMLFLLLSSVAFNVPRFWEYDVVACEGHEYDVTGFYVAVRSRTLKTSSAACASGFLWGYSAGVTLTINTLLPCLILFVLNVYIIRVIAFNQPSSHANAVAEEDETETSCDASGSASTEISASPEGSPDDPAALDAAAAADATLHGSSHRRRRNKIRIATRMCATVACVYLLLQVPYVISTIEGTRQRLNFCDIYSCQENVCRCLEKGHGVLGADDPKCPSSLGDVHRAVSLCYEEHMDDGDFLQELQPFMYLGLILNCSINLLLYASTSKSFRHSLLALLLGWITPVRNYLSRTMLEYSTSKSGSGVNRPGMTNVQMEELRPMPPSTSASPRIEARDASHVQWEQLRESHM